jgi:polyisoprenoid-binding protein YceI
MDAARYPLVSLQITKAEHREARTWAFEGNLTIKATTRRITGTVEVRHVPEAVAQQARLGAGEWVRVTTTFSVRLGDYGIQIPDGVGPKVSEVWAIGIDVYGTTQPPPRPE